MYRMVAGDLGGMVCSFNQFNPSWFFDIRRIVDCFHVDIMKNGIRSLEVEQLVDNLEIKQK